MKTLIKVFLMFIISLLFSATTYAAHWQWIDSDDKYGIFFDTDTICYRSIPRYPIKDASMNFTAVKVWLKVIYTQEGANDIAQANKNDQFYNLDHSLHLENFYFTDNTHQTFEIIYYDHNGDVLYRNKKQTREETILPESRGEHILKTIREYARTHHDQLVKNTYGR
nr:MAG TPA: Surface-adhesin protein E [Caudoviricetes sp.]